MGEAMRLLSEFERKAIENRLLFTHLIEIIDSCNAKCVFCYRRENEPVVSSMLSVSVLQRLARELKDLGAFHFKLTGGNLFIIQTFLR